MKMVWLLSSPEITYYLKKRTAHIQLAKEHLNWWRRKWQNILKPAKGPDSSLPLAMLWYGAVFHGKLSINFIS